MGASELTVLSNLSSDLHSCDQAQHFSQCVGCPPASPWILSRTRRSIEVALALIVLLLCAVPMLFLAVGIRLSSPGRALFEQERVGRKGRLFKILKFRSMSAVNDGPGLTRAGDSRITALGRFMRQFKIDELPQFYNVLRGQMSLVGPRPKLPRYAAPLNVAYRPGITGPATLAFRHEEELMRGLDQTELDSFYAQHIQPVKARIDTCYMCKATPASDLEILIETLLGCLRPAAALRPTISRPAAGSMPIPVHEASRSVGRPRPTVAAYTIANEEGAAGDL